MAVLRADAATAPVEALEDAHGPEWPRVLWILLTEELPADVRDMEVTVVTCFRASRVLNYLTGGQPEMTFSARCWRSQRTARTMHARLGWMVLTLVVDGLCASLRGERRHCAVAWRNYVRRPTRL